MMSMLTANMAIATASACELNPGKVTGGGQIPLVSGQTSLPGGSFGFNAMYYPDKGDPKGELEYVDHATGMKVHIHTMIAVYVSEDKTWATFEGPCTIDGEEDSYFAWIYVEDNGEPGKDDYFKIALSESGNQDFYVREGILLAGNIQIHKK